MSLHCKIAIIGGSFAWLSALLALRKRLWKDVSIRLFDLRAQFTHIPGLHEAVLDSSYLTHLQFSLTHYYPDEYLQEEITSLEPGRLQTRSWTERTFDYVVVATGSRTTYFGKDALRQYTHTVSYPEDIPPLNEALATASSISVLWGGHTGVEVASILAVRRRPDQHLRLIHGKTTLFNRLPEHLSDMALERLRRRHVELILWSKVENISSEAIILQDGTRHSSDVTIATRWIEANNELITPNYAHRWDYKQLEHHGIYLCWDVATHGLLSTGHNAMMEGRRTWHLIADRIMGIHRSYPPLENRDKLAIAIGPYDGIISNGHQGVFVPYLVWAMKRGILQRVLFEFKYKVMLPV